MKKILLMVVAAMMATVSVNAQEQYDNDYTYTIADGHIVEMVDNSTSVIKMNGRDLSAAETITSTFTYEEY